MRVILLEAFVPAALAAREEYLRQSGNDASATPTNGPDEFTTADAQEKPKIIWSFDGEAMFLNAAMEIMADKDGDHPELRQFELMKFCAACSMCQQPADVCPCFMVFKKYARLWLALDDEDRRPPYMARVEKLLEPIPQASRRLFLRYAAALPELVSSAFTDHNVNEGWEKSGLEPLEPKIMLGQCPAWKGITEAQGDAMLAAIPKLAKRVSVAGELTDKEIQEAVGTVFRFGNGESRPETGKKRRKELHEMTIPRRRAVWLTHPKIMAERAPKETAAAAPLAAVPVGRHCSKLPDHPHRSQFLLQHQLRSSANARTTLLQDRAARCRPRASGQGGQPRAQQLQSCRCKWRTTMKGICSVVSFMLAGSKVNNLAYVENKRN